MRAAVREIVEAYGHHPSFKGVAIRLSAHGYSQLPDPSWGMDDRTVAHFQRDVNVRLPGRGPERFAERARLLWPGPSSQSPYAGLWLQWRADQLHLFYRRVLDELTAVRPDAQLYLAGADMLSGEAVRRQLKPALPRRMTIAKAMMLVGVDVGHYRHDDRIVLLRPERVAPEWSLANRAVDLEIRQLPDFDRAFQELPARGSLFFHPPQVARLASFDGKSPFQPTYAWLATQPVPSAWQNRRRFVHNLATLDPQVMLDGGWQLPLGQEDSIRDLIAAYRQLPAVRFHRLSGPRGLDPAQPLTICYATVADATYAYVVNDAPFPTKLTRLNVTAPRDCRLDELSGRRNVPPLAHDADGSYWTVALEPYDLVAVRFSAPDVTLSHPEVSWPEEVRAKLEERIDDLTMRAASLRDATQLEAFDNPGFDRAASDDAEIPGWTVSSRAGARVELDPQVKRAGSHAAHLISEGPVVGLVSQAFAPPTTGRLRMAVWVRGRKSGGKTPSVRVVLEGTLEGRRFALHAILPVQPDWDLAIVRFDDLPLDGLSPLRIHFELIGGGEAWIDEVQLSDLVLEELEWKALLRIITPARPMLEKGQVRDCIHLLEGYWPRFLAANVPLASPIEAGRSGPSTSTEESEASPGFLDRLKAYLPRRLRVF
jgi:hypothetical protein